MWDIEKARLGQFLFLGCWVGNDIKVCPGFFWFLGCIVTHVLETEGDSKWTFFDGNY